MVEVPECIVRVRFYPPVVEPAEVIYKEKLVIRLPIVIPEIMYKDKPILMLPKVEPKLQKAVFVPPPRKKKKYKDPIE